MSTDTDLKIIEHTEGRARNMLRLCELARMGLGLLAQPAPNRGTAQWPRGFGETCRREAEAWILIRRKTDTPTTTKEVFAHLCALHPELKDRAPKPMQWTAGLLEESGVVHTPEFDPNNMANWHWIEKTVPKPMRMSESPQAVGGKARAEKLTPERRSAISKTAANTRWGKSHKGG